MTTQSFILVQITTVEERPSREEAEDALEQPDEQAPLSWRRSIGVKRMPAISDLKEERKRLRPLSEALPTHVIEQR